MERARDLGNEALIKRAQPASHLELTALALEAKQLWGYPQEWTHSWADDLRVTAADIERNPTFVAMLEDDLAGFYMLTTHHQKPWLEHLWVVPRFCRKGIGSKLLVHACGEAIQLKYTLLWIESDPNAERFYLKNGAKRVSERHTMMYGCERIVPILTFDLAPKSHSLTD
jgi:GNAT superfamily N-acetyltransferase